MSADFPALPEKCIADILSFTTPADACRLSLVSTTFNSAAGSDALWKHFLPSDYLSVISRSNCSATASLLAASSSLKRLYLALSDHPVIIDEGRKSFQLDKWSGKKCYMLAAREIRIVWGSSPEYWRWQHMPESRFPEVARLVRVCWLEICGKIRTRELSSETQYAVYLVFKMIGAQYFDRPIRVSIGNGFGGSHSSPKHVILDPDVEGGFEGLERPQRRNDGWWEIGMGEFFNSGTDDDELEVNVFECGPWKKGLYLQGIEVRPKEQNL